MNGLAILGTLLNNHNKEKSLNNSIQVPKVLASRAYTNNLPLALEPIRHTPNAHRSSMAIMLLLRKRIYHLIREIIDRGDVKICIVPTLDNIADPLTKPLAQQKYDGHTRSMGIRGMPDWL